MSTCCKCAEEATHRGRCKSHYNAYMREYLKARYHSRRELFMREMGGVCVRCGSTENLEFDHIDRTKKSFNIAKRLHGASMKTLRDELAKCQLLCADCHAKKSDECGDQRQVEHGDGLTGKRKCKCNECAEVFRAYNREYMRNYRAKNGRNY